MNNSTKAKYDVADRMLKGNIDPEEVAMITGIDIKDVLELKKKYDEVNHDVKVLGEDDNYDFNIGNILRDNYVIDEDIDKQY